MNKKIITIIAIFFSILFTDNVKASIIEETYKVPEDIYNNTLYDNNYSSDSCGYVTCYKALKELDLYESLNEKVKEYNMHYIYVHDNVYLWESDDIELTVYAKKNNSVNEVTSTLINPNNDTIYTISISKFINNNEITLTERTSSFINLGINKHYSGGTTISVSFNESYYKSNGMDYYYTLGFDTDSNVYYSTKFNSYASSGNYIYSSMILNDVLYSDGDLFYTPTPKITFSVSENKETINGEEIVTSKDLTVNFSIIDNENYRYLISFDRENWSSITIDEGNSMTFNIKENKTVYVQVLNASDYSMVTSAIYTIDGIIDKPSIYYNIIDEEKVPKAEKVYVVSKTLRTTFDIIDNDKYVYGYSLDGENWKTIKLVNGINYFDLKFNQEETVRTRILDRNTGKLITSATFTVGGITGYESSDGIIYKNLLKIPISSLYENGVWKTYQFVFMSDTENTYNYDIRIELVPYSNINDNNPIPLQIYMGQEISDIKEYQEKIQNSPTSDPDGYGGGFTMNGGTFGGGGGGGRFDENDIYHSCSTLPISESSTFKSKLNYKVVTILTNSCSDISSLTPSDFTTEYIYIYYNARMYESVEDAIDDNLNIDIPDDNIFYDNIIKPIIELINKKMPIIAQLKNILDSFQYVEENDSPPQFNVDLTSIGIPYNGIVVDFSFYAQYRDTIFFWIKVIFSVKTLIKILNIVKNMFGGGF